MPDLEFYERRAREAEELARLVCLPQNRQRYQALASAWRQLIAAAASREPGGPQQAA
jgi:hypothetical protein